VLSALGQPDLRCLRSSCRGGRAAANERVASATVKKLAPLPPNLPNLRRVDFESLYACGVDDEGENLTSDALAAAVAALPDSVVGMQMEALYGSDALVAAIGARRGLQSLGYASNGPSCVDVLGAVVHGPSLTSLTSLKLKVQTKWAPPPSLLQRVPWQQLEVGLAPPARASSLPPLRPGAGLCATAARVLAPVQFPCTQ
jgi:hypothetical protein